MSDVVRGRIEDAEEARLSPFASRSGRTRGRRYPSHEHDYRTAYQRDRDKVIYTPAFRRLQYKTQVFVNFEGDHYRTRLTHTIEASQIGRTIARALGANEDLVEAIILAHDLGHAPFGHASEEALNDLMTQPAVMKMLAGSNDPGGFEHNIQSLRIVDTLEGHSPDHSGLNLTWEVREGISKHRFTPGYPQLREFQETPQPGIEAQIADIADEISYDCHDVDDGLRAGLLDVNELSDNHLWKSALARAKSHTNAGNETDLRYHAVSTLIDQLVTNVIDTTLSSVEAKQIASPDDVRAFATRLVDFGPDIRPHAASLKTFLYSHLYYHFQVVRMKEKARRLIGEIFNAYLDVPHQLPIHIRHRVGQEGVPLPRVICDYVAGMTDRYAVDEHRKLFEIDVKLLP